MTSAELRQSFLDFFKARGHTIVPSASLMPSSPNLLFTNAGMNQFVPYFLGERQAPYPRAADTQKCIRAGGKHNDLEDVGFDTYHHTLFEMLGNWSFGDYFKKEAINWAWELLTKVWGFPKERLYATVYKPAEGDPAETDIEAYAFWKAIYEKEGLDPDKHIRYGNKADNFWMMGDTGPCGPCSELHVDLTPQGDTHGRLVNADSPWCIEIWNLVFIQFNANADGSFTPLKARHIDTGMGFERVAGILATTKKFTDYSKPPSNYNSDLFTDLFAEVEKMSGHAYGYTMPESRGNLSEAELRDAAFRVLADHIRTLTFSIADGILPGNEGRNYVLRRILRRAVLWGRKLDLHKGFFTDLATPLIEKMGGFFPELKQQETVIRKVLKNEEDSFARTLDRGLAELDKIIARNDKVITGADAFLLYDTYGFPLDLTQLIARERGLTIDLEGFETEMQKQREKARAAQKKEVIEVAGSCTFNTVTKFVGYNNDNLTNFSTNTGEASAEFNSPDIAVSLAETPFYTEMGGQVGDKGSINFEGGQTGQVVGTEQTASGSVIHFIEGIQLDTTLASGASVTVSVDIPRRRAIERHHTATHILHWALRKVLGSHVHQAGSYVGPDRLRFDFSHFEAISAEQLDEIERLCNEKVLANDPVRWYEIPYEDKPDDIVAFFGEKYGNVVRVVEIGGEIELEETDSPTLVKTCVPRDLSARTPGYSAELCGGTHVLATGELGLIKIVGETAISAGTRRIEALAGVPAFEYAAKVAGQLGTLARELSCKAEEVPARIAALQEQRAELEKKVRKLQQQGAGNQLNDILANATEREGIKLASARVEVDAQQDLRGLAASALKQLGEGTVVLGAEIDGKATVVAASSPKAIEAGFKAGEIIRSVANELGGKGGGKPDFAMGGGNQPGLLEAALRNPFTS